MGTPRVLVVDDQLLVRKALSRHLVAAGYDVRLAGDGVEGLAQCLSFRPHVVILDRRLPRLGGDELALQIAEQVDEAPAVFMLTGEPTQPDVTPPGVIALFSKPIAFETLRAAIAPYLEGR